MRYISGWVVSFAPAIFGGGIFLHLYCLICDSDPASKDYFNKHIELMKSLEQDIEYEEIKSIDKFFNIE